MKEDITFEKGLYPQLDQTIKIPGTYLDALNMIRDEAGSMYNELGTSLVTALDSSFKIIGHYILNDDIILISTNGTTTNIGVLDSTDTYTLYLSTDVLGYNTETRLSVEGGLITKGKDLYT